MLQNKVVLITGAFSGIGRAAVDLFMQSRCKVVAVGRDSTGKIPSYTGNYLPIIRNIRSERDGEELVEFTLEKYNRIDVLIHCAGKMLQKPLAETTKADFDKVFNDNFYSAVHMTQAALPYMKRQKEAAILFMGITEEPLLLAHAPAFCAAKQALATYVRSIQTLPDSRVKATLLTLTGVNTNHGHVLAKPPHTLKLMTPDDAARIVWLAAQQPDSAAIVDWAVRPLAWQG